MKNAYLISGLLALLVAWSAVATEANKESFKEGVHYRLLADPLDISNKKGKVEVVEFFWYGCPHCYRLEPSVQAWQEGKADNVDFSRITPLWGKVWSVHARAYYAAEKLGVLDKVHEPLMKAIHEQRRPLNTEKQLADFFSGLGVDRDKFTRAYRSFDVENRMRHGQKVAAAAKIRGVPAVLVNGKYLVNASTAGSNEKVFQVVDFLVARESAASSPAPASGKSNDDQGQ